MDTIITDKIIKIELSSPPLTKHAYMREDLMTRCIAPSDRSGLLLDAIKEHESRILEAEKNLYEEAVTISQLLKPEDNPALFNEIEAYQQARNVEHCTPTAIAPQKKQFRQLNRKPRKFTIYDYSDIEQGELEEQIDQLINSDGYYNEVLPVDADIENNDQKSFNKRIFIPIGILVALTVLSILYIRSMF